MTTRYYYNNIIPNTGFNRYNTSKELYYYAIGNNQDNFGVTQSKYSSFTA